MYQNMIISQQNKPKQKTIIIAKNGQPDTYFKLQFTKPVTKQYILHNIEKNWKSIKYKSIRIFGIDGVQYFNQDLLYLKNNDRLFISKGQDFDSNRNFGQYQIIKQLGQGGFGSVSLVKNKITGEYAAIKVIKTNKIYSSKCIDMIFKQAQNLKSLNHPNIVKIINCYSLKNMKFVVVMQYVQGGQLNQLLKSKIKFQQEQALNYFKQIINAVSHCHRAGIVHQDLKLQNMLLTKNHQVKVADFGISGVADRFNPQLNWGTLKYMPPQVFSKSKTFYAFARDVWACGIILFYMLQGYLPFTGHSSRQIINNIIYKPVQFSNSCNISKNCRDLILKMLQKNPQKRITMSQIQNSSWIIKGCGGDNLIVRQPIKQRNFKQINNITKIPKKIYTSIPKKLQKHKIQIITDQKVLLTNRKHLKSQVKPIPQIKSARNKNQIPLIKTSKISYLQYEINKKQYFKAI